MSTLGEMELKENCIYKNAKQPVEARVKDLLSRMTVEEKVGQITQIERRIATAEPDVITKFFIGILIHLSLSSVSTHILVHVIKILYISLRKMIYSYSTFNLW